MAPAFSLALPATSGGLSPAEAARVERDVANGGLFVDDPRCELHARGEVIFRFADGEVVVVATVVLVTPHGAGLELALSAAQREALCAKLRASVARPSAPQPAASAADPDATDATDATDDDGPDATDATDATDDDGPDAALYQPALLRLRNLSVAEQLKVAHRGEYRERVALERLYGKLVWEALLRNPRITVPEVGRIAKMGALPRPLIELIVSNPAWLQVAEIRRALLGNPRLPVEHIAKLLRLLPRHELRLLPQQTAYPVAVRDVARRLLRL